MKYLIVNADDFGMSKGITDGIVEAHQYGAVSSTTMLANTEYFDYAVSLAKQTPNLGVGVHLNLTLGEPVASEVPSLVNRKGHFFKLAEFREKSKHASAEDLEKELTAQVEKILEAGIEITHLDTHNYIHRLPSVCEVVSKLARKYGVGARKAAHLSKDIITTEEFTDKFSNDATDINFKVLLKKFEGARSLEIMCRPGYFETELITKTGYTKKRELELSVLSKYELQMHMKRLGIRLINFRELAEEEQ